MPNKPNFRKAEINAKHLFAESYENKTELGLCENKANQSQFWANFKAEQSQTKPIGQLGRN
jgi:hypothetical protein